MPPSKIQGAKGSVWVAGVDDAWDYDCADLPRAFPVSLRPHPRETNQNAAKWCAHSVRPL